MMHRTGLISIFLISLVLTLPSPAQAVFGKCTEGDYLGRFPDSDYPDRPERPPIPGLICIELFRIDVPTSGGVRQIRGIQDVSADWAFSPGATAAVERGARLTVDALRLLGGFQIDDVTLLILDDADVTVYRGDEREVLARTDGRGRPDAGRPGECLVTLYMLSLGGDPDELAVTVAHEIFHCLQYASLSAAQMATLGIGVGQGGDWWIEGSAGYFSAIAVPESQAQTDRSARFDDMVESGVALNTMTHEAVTFFYWLHDLRGPSGLMPFMHAMASTSGAEAQHAKMRSELTDEQWLQFAQDYADRAIQHPQGGALASSPPGGEVLIFSESETLEYPMEAFVISLGTVEYECGTWENTLTPSDANVAVQDLGGSPWSDFPTELDTRDGAGNYRIVAMQTDSDESTLSIEAERTVSCELCGGSDRVDACLVGTWFMSGGGPIEWMKNQGIPITRSYSGPRLMSFSDDGIYGTGGFAAGIVIEDDDSFGRGDGTLTDGAGRWSVAEGQMNICQDSGALSGTATSTYKGSTITGSISQPAAGQLSMSYSCSPTSLTTTMGFPGSPGMSPMVTQYTKILEVPALSP